ncbi:MAG: alkylmercury lyase family protein, partial [Proteobacteria bacterium]|nr:alkylmercury lyase family protein [Pseudomonadota bacterium]
KLNSQLPLKERQDKLPQELKDLHRAVLHSLINQGRPSTSDELADQFGKETVESGLARLGADDLIVLDADGMNPVGAYPITSEQTPHKIIVKGHAIHAMCALDAVSVAPMFDTNVVIESECRVTKTPITIRMHGSKILEAIPTPGIIIGIRWQMPSGAAAHSMCMEMVFLKDSKTAKDWQGGDVDNSSLFSLPDAVEFGKAFFLPLLEQ